MSRILKHIMNSAITNSGPNRILYYPSNNKEIDNEIFKLPYLYYLTKDDQDYRQLSNIYYVPDSISGFLDIDFYCIIITNPFSELEHAVKLSSQLHIPLFNLCYSNPDPKFKIEDIYFLNERLEKFCTTICLSSEFSENWLLTEYKTVESTEDIPGVLEECTKIYLRK